MPYFENNSYNITFLKKMYVWSVCLDPLLFFVIFEHVATVGQNVSRYMQFLILITLLARVGSWQIVKIYDLFKGPYKCYSNYYLFSFVSLIFGIAFGYYNIPNITFEEAIIVTFYRPVLEYIIAAYYFVYFVILTRYMITSSSELNYFFKIFSFLFYMSLYVGLFDVAVMMLFDYEGLPRHLSDMTAVGARYHGFAGEPRDAFVYLLFGAAVLWLKDVWRGENQLNKKVFFIIIIAAVLTKSASGLFGLLFSSILLIFYYLSVKNVKTIMATVLIMIVFSAIIAISISNFDRINRYYEAFNGIITILESGEEGNSILKVAMNNIYPLWHRWIEVLNLNFIPLIIGTGLGSSSVINNVYPVSARIEVMNPNANIVRMIYDVGVIGVFLLIRSFVSPIKNFAIPKYIKNYLMLFMLIILGTFFAHRSGTPFILLGVIVVMFNYKSGLMNNRLVSINNNLDSYNKRKSQRRA